MCLRALRVRWGDVFEGVERVWRHVEEMGGGCSWRHIWRHLRACLKARLKVRQGDASEDIEGALECTFEGASRSEGVLRARVWGAHWECWGHARWALLGAPQIWFKVWIGPAAAEPGSRKIEIPWTLNQKIGPVQELLWTLDWTDGPVQVGSGSDHSSEPNRGKPNSNTFKCLNACLKNSPSLE
jgi:hypothetical protein